MARKPARLSSTSKRSCACRSTSSSGTSPSISSMTYPGLGFVIKATGIAIGRSFSSIGIRWTAAICRLHASVRGSSAGCLLTLTRKRGS